VASVRRLSAIMFTDMVGSTSSAQENEAEALKLRDEQAGIVRPLFAAHQGREIKSMGDGFLAEFDSALRAVQCAIDIQQHLHERNSQPSVAPIELRIGIHLGDVEQRENDIFGDAVNIASRIEPVASPGGLCITGSVVDQVRNKIPNRLERLPTTSLKGLKVPVDIYRVVLPWTLAKASTAGSGFRRLAVLPFTNISPDPKDEYFADGLTEELIAVLSQLRGLRVIARTSVTPYKASTKGVSQIGTELGVDAILEGSVRKAGDDLRITVQLIDVGTEEHSWATSYDRRLEKVFTVQADIAKQVAEALEVALRPAEEARLDSRPSVGSDSYLAYLKGRTLLHDNTQASIEGAREQFARAIALDPKNAAAHAGLADAVRFRGWWEDSQPGSAWDQESRRLLARAIELDRDLPEAHASLGLMHYDDWEWAASERELRLAVSLNPSYSLGHTWLGELLECQGRGDEAVAEYTLAEGADPLGPGNLKDLVKLLVWLGRPDEALPRIQKLKQATPDDWEFHVWLSAYHISRSDLASGIKELQRALELSPGPTFDLLIRVRVHMLAGKVVEARAMLQPLEAEIEKQFAPSLVAWLYAELGDLDGCFRWLEAGFRRRSLNLNVFFLDPKVARVRNDPRFLDLLKRMNLVLPP
jgi:adenylate cyclase